MLTYLIHSAPNPVSQDRKAAHQKVNKRLERYIPIVLDELLVDVIHILIAVHDTQTCQGGYHLRQVEGIRFSLVKVPECALKLFKLGWSQVGVVS